MENLPLAPDMFERCERLFVLMTDTQRYQVNDEGETGTTYRQLMQDTQHQVGTELPIDTTETVSEIAFQTGFSEQSAFTGRLNAGPVNLLTNTENVQIPHLA